MYNATKKDRIKWGEEIKEQIKQLGEKFKMKDVILE